MELLALDRLAEGKKEAPRVKHLDPMEKADMRDRFQRRLQELREASQHGTT